MKQLATDWPSPPLHDDGNGMMRNVILTTTAGLMLALGFVASYELAQSMKLQPAQQETLAARGRDGFFQRWMELERRKNAALRRAFGIG